MVLPRVRLTQSSQIAFAPHVVNTRVCHRLLLLFSLSSRIPSLNQVLKSTMTEADKGKMLLSVPSLLDTPDPSASASPHTPPPRSRPALDTTKPHLNFTGSSLPADYVFNIDLPPDAHPPDVQAYLYCVGSASPSTKGTGWKLGVEAGACLLRSVRDNGRG